MFKIEIKKPCNQVWQQMDLLENGRYCTNCHKTVVDFTTMTSDEIVKYLSNHQTVCGRFGESQIDVINVYSSTSAKIAGNKYRRWLVAAASFLWTIFALKTFAKDNKSVPQEQTVTGKRQQKDYPLKSVIDTGKYITIRGKITDSLNFSLFGTAIISLPSGKSTNADKNGLFELMIPTVDKQLQINSIGFNSQLITINRARQEYNVILKQAPNIMGEVSIYPKSSNH